MKTRSISLLAASLLVLVAGQTATAVAQEQPAQDSAPQAEAQAAEAQVDDQASQAQADDQAADDQAGSEAAGDVADGGQPAKSAAPPVVSAPKSGPKLGPGGKPLREDYPGTEESKQARMATERIEGLAFNEGETADEAYDLRIRDLETKVDDLKETVFRSKSRIVLLKETVLNGTVAGSRAIVNHVNELGSTYVLRRAMYSLDGARIFNEQGSKGGLGDRAKIEVFKGSVTPGTHRISVLMELQGSGYNVFSYMDGYKFSVQDSCEFTAQEGSSAMVQVRLYEKGGAFSRYEDSLGIECSVNLVELSKSGWVEEATADAPEAAEAP